MKHAGVWSIAVGFVALVFWASADLSAWLQARAEAARCRIPEPHEQLYIVVVQRGRMLVADCMYVAPRGAAAAAAREAKR